jgi:2-amino-4-hydroxy-6-hydroxymethyldihydropteridine diphosphokinase
LNKVYLLLGSNLGDRLDTLVKAQKYLSEHGEILSISSVYETKPWGKSNQPNFLNQVLLIETNMSAEELLKKILGIEILLGRVREQKWAERTIDIDILYFNNEIIVTESLKIPHPEIHNRKFTLVPLNEISPDFLHPVFNLSTRQMLERCNDTLEVMNISSEKGNRQ